MLKQVANQVNRILLNKEIIQSISIIRCQLLSLILQTGMNLDSWAIVQIEEATIHRSSTTEGYTFWEATTSEKDPKMIFGCWIFPSLKTLISQPIYKKEVAYGLLLKLKGLLSQVILRIIRQLSMKARCTFLEVPIWTKTTRSFGVLTYQATSGNKSALMATSLITETIIAQTSMRPKSL